MDQRKNRMDKNSDTRPLYKTTIVIWSDFDPDSVDIADLSRDATSGESYCSKKSSELIADPKSDADWDGTEFFDTPFDDEDVDVNGDY